MQEVWPVAINVLAAKTASRIVYGDLAQMRAKDSPEIPKTLKSQAADKAVHGLRRNARPRGEGCPSLKSDEIRRRKSGPRCFFQNRGQNNVTGKNFRLQLSKCAGRPVRIAQGSQMRDSHVDSLVNHVFQDAAVIPSGHRLKATPRQDCAELRASIPGLAGFRPAGSERRSPTGFRPILIGSGDWIDTLFQAHPTLSRLKSDLRSISQGHVSNIGSHSGLLSLEAARR